MTIDVLVVDDEPSICQLLTRWLEGWGYTVHSASNSADALRHLSQFRMAIVLCDVGLGQEDGVSLATQVRERGRVQAS